MMKRTFARSLAALVLMLVGFVQVAPEVMAKGQPRPARPFRGSAEGVVTGLIAPSPECLFGGFTALWTGNATHLGRFTRQERLCFTNEELTEFEGEMVFTAANGDRLIVRFSGEFEPGPVEGMLLAEGPYEIIGGTGRFSNASGTAHYEAFAVPVDGEFVVGVEFDGFIRY